MGEDSLSELDGSEIVGTLGKVNPQRILKLSEFPGMESQVIGREYLPETGGFLGHHIDVDLQGTTQRRLPVNQYVPHLIN
jgi:hypothetical protein